MTTPATPAVEVLYRDLNANGIMDPFEDPRLSPEERVADLLPRLSVEEKAGLLFHQVLPRTAPGDHDASGTYGSDTPRSLVCDKFINHFNVHNLPPAREAARWINALQELAATTPHGIPITFSSDPRHGFTDNALMAMAPGSMSQWPEPLGLAAIGDSALVRDFASTVRQEYLAVGIRAALHPQIDLATEPRWGRQAQTFGQDSETAAVLVTEYLAGLQGEQLGPASVACTTKHFPGGGPQKDGEDPHFPYGREQVYPGGRFREHLAPFRAAIKAGTSGIMPYYGMPVGLELDNEPVEEVGFGFNHRIVTSLLREELGFDGVVLTDWQLLTDLEVSGLPFPAKAWGVEHLSRIERLAAIIEAGADQLGGETVTDLLLQLLDQGVVSMERIDESVRRILLVKFQLGLFDNPFVDEDAAVSVVGSEDFRVAGHRAQASSITVLKDDLGLPLRTGLHLYVEGVDPAVAVEYGTVVADPADADVAIIRLKAPFEARNSIFLEAVTHQGSLDFSADTVEHVRALAAQVPLILDVYLDRPAILTPVNEVIAGLVANYGASDAALLDALTGKISPCGRLPFELPRSMNAVRSSRPDVPSDSENPLYPYGSGRTAHD